MSSGSAIQEETMRKGLTLVTAAVSTPGLLYLEDKINDLAITVALQKMEIESLKKELADIKKTIPFKGIRIPDRKVLGSVVAYLKEKKEAYPSEIADALGISVREVMEAISFLHANKKVEEV